MTTALTKCRYCEHGNPPDSKYCNACGATLTLAPCPHCGAVNQITATTCYQCRGSLQESSKDALVPALLAAADVQPSLRHPSLAFVGTAAVALVTFIGYYAYHHYSLVKPPPSPAANTEAKDRSGPVQPASTPSPAAAPALRVTATPSSAGPAPAAAVAPAARPETTKASELVSPRSGACTEKIAALGLCSPKPVRKKKAEAAAVPAAVAPPRTSNGGEPCTEAVAALGLCTPKSK